MNEEIFVFGHKIDKKNFPILYKWATTDIKTLEDQLESLANKAYESDIVTAMQMLESDLEHHS
ncbi:hypothetical protein IPM65_02225 [Candidatus Roizmanbacteria bacterium]|nr:MAG: hypothetical protein IPM65_02225 [Candidatus Roizmanbacteria bacterium]